VAIEGLRDRVPAILFSGYNGQSQGAALADVVFGAQNPAGHLNFTWYRDDSQLPPMGDYRLTSAPGRTYQYFTGKPTYPFGYGLSYSSFQVSDVVTDRKAVHAGGTVTVGLTVTNTGKLPGATVVQLYASTPGAGHGSEPLSRLAGFQKTRVLEPGATQHVTLPVTLSDLALWDTARSREVVPAGAWRFRVGTDAATSAGERTVTVNGTWKPGVSSVSVQPEAVVYQAGQTFDLTGVNRWLADDTRPAEEPDRDLSIRADGVVTAVNADQSFVDLSQARVRYTSSNPAVASVDRSGVVRAIKDGVATITTTVNGVSGSAVIAVRGTLTQTTPVIMVAGQTATAGATFTNGGTKAVTGVALAVTVPAGWTATATTPTSFARVPGGRTVTATWRLTPAAGAEPQAYPIGYTATSSEGTFTASAQTNVPYASVAAAYDNTGVSADGVPVLPGFDGGSLSFSAQALAANGFVAGEPVTVGGIRFTWPGTGVPDNIVGSGQAVPLSGTGHRLGFLGASNNGTASGTGTVVYTDGSTAGFALGFADWWSGGAIPGTSIAATTPYLNNDTGQQNQTVHVYFASVPLDPGRTVAYVVLPHVTDHGQVAQITALHVFALGIGD
jgi:hypothetical protein